MNSLVSSLENFFKQFPSMPPAWRENLAKVMPWIALIFGILSLLFGVMAVLGAGALTAVAPIASQYAGQYAGVAGTAMIGATALVWLGAIFLIAYGAILLIAYGPLKRRAMKGWNMIFYLELVYVASQVLDLITFNIGGLVTGVIGSLIGLYLLFQIRPLYK